METTAATAGALQPAPFEPTAEQIALAAEQVEHRTFSPEFQSWTERYARVGYRNAYIWRWCRLAVELTTLPSVLSTLRDEVIDTKTLGVMWDVLLDDVADQKGDFDLLTELLRLPHGEQPRLDRFADADREYARFTCDVWNEIQQRAASYPLYEQYRRLLQFDYLQLANVMRYSHLLNEQPALLNLTEHDLYTPHNMHMMVCSTVDLMASLDFDPAEVGRLREIIWQAQWMGRIGNLVTTWERELGEGDYTSGVYARALACGDLTMRQLEQGDEAAIRAAIKDRGHEDYYLARWQQHRRHILEQADRLRSIDVHEIVAGLERLYCIHLASRGYK